MNYRDIKGRKEVGGVGSRRPSKAVVVEAVGVVEAPAVASFADAICAPAATFGGEREESVQWRPWRRRVHRGGVAGVGGASRRWQRPFSRSG